MSQIAEFKLALDKPPSGKWEDTPTHLCKLCTDKDAADWANYLSETYGCQVQWSYRGSTQWHYAQKETHD